jgi:hypothetical protein
MWRGILYCCTPLDRPTVDSPTDPFLQCAHLLDFVSRCETGHTSPSSNLRRHDATARLARTLGDGWMECMEFRHACVDRQHVLRILVAVRVILDPVDEGRRTIAEASLHTDMRLELRGDRLARFENLLLEEVAILPTWRRFTVDLELDRPGHVQTERIAECRSALTAHRIAHGLAVHTLIAGAECRVRLFARQDAIGGRGVDRGGQARLDRIHLWSGGDGRRRDRTDIIEDLLILD